MVAWPQNRFRTLYAQAAYGSLSTFVRKVYGVERNPKGTWWDDAVHEPLCAWLQTELLAWIRRRQAGCRERTYLAALLPRAAAKTNLITKAAMLWLMLHDPELAIYIGNEKRENAVDFLAVIKAHLEGADDYSWWQWLYGNWRSDDSRWRQDLLVHNARTSKRSEASYGVVSIGTGLTGKHPDVICLDDLVSYEGLANDVDLYESANSFINSLVPVLEANGLMILVGTRYADNDPFGHAFSTLGIQSVAGVPDPDYSPTPGGVWQVYFLSGRRNQDQAPAIPSVWSEAAMVQYAKQDPVKFAYQVLNKPKLSPFRPITEAQFDSHVVFKVPKFLKVSLHYDTAFKHFARQASGCESAIVAMGHDMLDRGKVYFLGAWFDRMWSSEDFLRKSLEATKLLESQGYTIKCITDEKESGGKSGVFESLVRTAHIQAGHRPPQFIGILRQVRQENKDQRIYNLIGYIHRGLLKFHAEAPGLGHLRYQLCNHPDSALKDVADAAADCIHPDVYTSILLAAHGGPEEEASFGGWEEDVKRKRWWKATQYAILDTEIDRDPV